MTLKPMTLKLLIHAPTATALVRARRNLLNFLAQAPGASVELVINGEAVRAALASPDAATDACLVLCRNSLAAAQLSAPDGMCTVSAAVLHIAQRQADGWAYFRA